MNEHGSNNEGLFSLLGLLAILRAQYIMYQSSHWQTKGPNYYGNHLLFERLYKSVPDQVDQLAEKIVAQWGPEYVDPSPSVDKIKYWVDKWCQVTDFHQRGLNSEEDFMKVCREAYDSLKATNQLTLGMDDFLMATANDHETNIYLLKQVLR